MCYAAEDGRASELGWNGEFGASLISVTPFASFPGLGDRG